MKRDVKVPVYCNNRKLIGYTVYDTKTMLAWDSTEKTTAAYGDLHEGMGDGGRVKRGRKEREKKEQRKSKERAKKEQRKSNRK